MTESTLTITYTRPGRDVAGLDLLMIEQERWLPYVGRVTKSEVVGQLAAWLYSEAWEGRMDCGLQGGMVVCAVHAYPRVAGLGYQFHASHGYLSERSVAMVEVSEIVNFRLTDREQPKYPPRTIASASWMGNCYTQEGDEIPPPTLSIDDGELVSALPVYGAVEVRYLTERHTYILSTPRREEALDNHYSAVVYGVYSGGLSWLEIDMPPGIEAFEADPNAICGWGDSGSVTGPEDEDRPVTPRGADRITVQDYCSGEIISDQTYTSGASHD